MWSCKKVKQVLPDYIDGDLSSKKAAAAEQHLHLCAECQTELQAYQSLSKLTVSRVLPEPPHGYWEDYAKRVMCRTGQFRGRTETFLMMARLRWAASAVAVAVTVLLAAVIYWAFLSARGSSRQYAWEILLTAKQNLKEGEVLPVIDEIAHRKRSAKQEEFAAAIEDVQIVLEEILNAENDVCELQLLNSELMAPSFREKLEKFRKTIRSDTPEVKESVVEAIEKAVGGASRACHLLGSS